MYMPSKLIMLLVCIATAAAIKRTSGLAPSLRFGLPRSAPTVVVSAGAASGADEADAPPSAGTAIAVDLWLTQNGTRSALADGSTATRASCVCTR